MAFGESLFSEMLNTALAALPYLGAALAYLVAGGLLLKRSRKAGWAVLAAGALLLGVLALMVVGGPLFQRWAMDHALSYESMRWMMVGKGFLLSGGVCVALLLALSGAFSDRGGR